MYLTLFFLVPPKFDDLGKEARDVFSKEFGYGFFKLDAKTVSKKGVVSKANQICFFGFDSLTLLIILKYKGHCNSYKMYLN